MDEKQQVDDLLRSSGAVLVRQGKHLIYRLPNGKTFVQSKTSSDRNSHHADLAELRRALGIKNEGAGEGERRKKIYRPKPQPKFEKLNDKPALNTALADKLQIAGVIEDRLQEEIKYLQTDNALLRQEISEMTEEVEVLQNKECGCLGCRFSRCLGRLKRKVLLYK